jgi:hypothetical protein
MPDLVANSEAETYSNDSLAIDKYRSTGKGNCAEHWRRLARREVGHL